MLESRRETGYGLGRRIRILRWAVLGALPVVAAQIAVGHLFDARPGDAWLAVGLFLLAVLLLGVPGVFLAMALPATYFAYRVGPQSTDISVADVVLGIAIIAAFPFVPWRSRTLQSMLRVLASYLLVLAIPIVVVFSKRAALEWGHRAFLVGGGLCVGAAIAATGRTTRALRAFLLASAVVAVAAVYDALSRWHSGSLPPPAYPFEIQKNAAGFLLVCALVVMLVVPRVAAVPRALRVPAAALLLIGVAACQARSAAITLMGVVVFWLLHERRVKPSPIVVVAAMLLIAMTYLTVNEIFQTDAKDNRFSSVNSRVATYEAALDLWKQDPIVGVGLKFWRDPAFTGKTAFGEPHNLVVSALGESGVIGLGALCLLFGATLTVVRRSRTDLAALAVLVWIATAADSLVGIFWVAGTLTFAWIVVGLACSPGSEHEHPVRSRELATAS